MYVCILCMHGTYVCICMYAYDWRKKQHKCVYICMYVLLCMHIMVQSVRRMHACEWNVFMCLLKHMFRESTHKAHVFSHVNMFLIWVHAYMVCHYASAKDLFLTVMSPCVHTTQTGQPTHTGHTNTWENMDTDRLHAYHNNPTRNASQQRDEATMLCMHNIHCLGAYHLASLAIFIIHGSQNLFWLANALVHISLRPKHVDACWSHDPHQRILAHACICYLVEIHTQIHTHTHTHTHLFIYAAAKLPRRFCKRTTRFLRNVHSHAYYVSLLICTWPPPTHRPKSIP